MRAFLVEDSDEMPSSGDFPETQFDVDPHLSIGGEVVEKVKGKGKKPKPHPPNWWLVP
jgi:hypothetical protein